MSLIDKFRNIFKRGSRGPLEEVSSPLTTTTKCEWCGKKFHKTHHLQKYCSDECRKEVKSYHNHLQHLKRKEKKKTNNLPKKHRRPNAIEVLPNGLELISSACVDYTSDPKWEGGETVYYGHSDHKFPLTISQLKDLKAHFDEIPKKIEKNRRIWLIEKYGVDIKHPDRIIWNMYRGKFETIFKKEFLKNHRLQFNENGELITGGK